MSKERAPSRQNPPVSGEAAFPLTPSLAAMIVRAAAARGIAGGRPEALMERLESLGADLFSGAWAFPAFFAADSNVYPVPGLWEIGEHFWKSAPSSLERRRLEGSFYTPAPVIDRVLDPLWGEFFPSGKRLRPVRICDPAVGCGFFFLRLLDRLEAEEGRAPAELRGWAADNLHGVDLDVNAVFMTRVLLWLRLSDARREFLPDPARFRRADSLLGPAFGQKSAEGDPPPAALDWALAFPEAARAGGFDAVIGNPPYEVLTNFGRRPERRELVLALRRCGHYRDSLQAQINLYRCFIERSLDLLRPGGSLAFIVPLSLARDEAAAPLRRRLLLSEAASEWRLFGEKDRLFSGVTQSLCVFRARRGAGAAETIRVGNGGDTVELTPGELAQCAGEALVVPNIARRDLGLWRWLWEHCPARLERIADMRVGEVDQTFFRDCMADADTGCVLARGSHLSPFLLDVNPLPGRERFLDLKRFLDKKGASAEECRARSSVWRIAQMGIRNLHTRPRLLAALMPPGVYAGNSLNVFLPREGVPLAYLAGLLNSRLLDWLFCLTSGNNNINLREMRNLPVPSPPEPERVAAVELAYAECVAAAEKGAGDLSREREALDKAVARCYGAPEDLLRTALGETFDASG